MFTKNLLLLFATLLFHYAVYSQPYSISGSVLDETDNSALIGVSVVLVPVSDTAQKLGAVTDLDGNFSVQNLPAAQYQLRISYVGFQNYMRTLNVADNIDLGAIKLKTLSTQLQNVTVTGQQIRAQQSGDTTSFNAGAYKTNPDANAEDLINAAVTRINNFYKNRWSGYRKQVESTRIDLFKELSSLYIC